MSHDDQYDDDYDDDDDDFDDDDAAAHGVRPPPRRAPRGRRPRSAAPLGGRAELRGMLRELMAEEARELEAAQRKAAARIAAGEADQTLRTVWLKR